MHGWGGDGHRACSWDTLVFRVEGLITIVKERRQIVFYMFMPIGKFHPHSGCW